MKNIFLITALFFLSIGYAAAQQEATSVKLTKAKKRKARKEAEKKYFETLITSVEDSTFVLEASTLNDRYGNVAPVMGNTNFIAVDKDKGTIQLSFPHLIGPNGLGGITLEGRVTRYEVTKDPDKQRLQVRMDFFGTGAGTKTLFMRVSAGGQATVRVQGFTRHRLDFNGRLLPLSQSRIYKGRTQYLVF